MTPAPQVDLVDAHVHVWDRARHAQPWIDPVAMAPIDRDFDLQALRADVDNAPPPRVVLVQTVPAESETRDLLETALTDPLVAGVVGWTLSIANGRAPAGGHGPIGPWSSCRSSRPSRGRRHHRSGTSRTDGDNQARRPRDLAYPG